MVLILQSSTSRARSTIIRSRNFPARNQNHRKGHRLRRHIQPQHPKWYPMGRFPSRKFSLLRPCNLFQYFTYGSPHNLTHLYSPPKNSSLTSPPAPFTTTPKATTLPVPPPTSKAPSITGPHTASPAEPSYLITTPTRKPMVRYTTLTRHTALRSQT
jgi:hypothetical protein